MASSSIGFGQAEIETNRFYVSQMEIPVGFGWETGDYQVVWYPTIGEIVFDDPFEEIQTPLFLLLHLFRIHGTFLRPFQRGSRDWTILP
jgi:hypothetical protein